MTDPGIARRLTRMRSKAADLLLEIGDPQTAVQNARLNVADATRALGPMDPATIRATMSLLDALDIAGQLDEALDLAASL